MRILGCGNHEPSLSGRRAQDALVTDLVNPRWRDGGGDLLQEFQRLEDDVGGPVAPAALEAIKEPSVREA
jgi:hypothetical protein